MSMKNDGVIKGKLYEIEVWKNENDEIGANVKVEIGADSIIPITFYATRLTKAGNPSKTYSSFMNFLNTSKTVINHNEEADFVHVKMPQLTERLYSPDGQAVISNTQIKGVFFERIPACEPIAEIQVEGVVKLNSPEIGKDAPTGALNLEIMNTATATGAYSQKFNLLVPAEPKANVDFVNLNYTIDRQVLVTVVPTVIDNTIEKVIQTGFGGDIVETIIDKKITYQVIKGTMPTEPSLALETLTEGNAVRENRKQTARANFLNKKSATPTTATTAAPQFSL